MPTNPHPHVEIGHGDVADRLAELSDTDLARLPALVLLGVPALREAGLHPLGLLQAVLLRPARARPARARRGVVAPRRPAERRRDRPGRSVMDARPVLAERLTLGGPALLTDRWARRALVQGRASSCRRTLDSSTLPSFRRQKCSRRAPGVFRWRATRQHVSPPSRVTAGSLPPGPVRSWCTS